jgi:hypothetical protein
MAMGRPWAWRMDPFWNNPNVTESRTMPSSPGIDAAMRANVSSSPSGVAP